MSSFLDWAVAERPLPGETVSGDGYLVVFQKRTVLLAVTDGIGHGPEAAAASRAALAVVEEHSAKPLPEIVALCDEALVGLRGVVMTIAQLDGATGTVGWLSVGNVTGALLRAGSGAWEEVFQSGGILGSRRLSARTPELLAMEPYDYLIFATDGLAPEFLSRVSLSAPADEIARSILLGYAKDEDDALVLVARYLGSQGVGGSA